MDHLYVKVSFVRSDLADWKLPWDNQRESNSVFKVTRIIHKEDVVIVRLHVRPKKMRKWNFNTILGLGMSAQHFLGSVRPWLFALQCLQHRRVIEALHKFGRVGLGNNRFRRPQIVIRLSLQGCIFFCKNWYLRWGLWSLCRAWCGRTCLDPTHLIWKLNYI